MCWDVLVIALAIMLLVLVMDFGTGIFVRTIRFVCQRWVELMGIVTVVVLLVYLFTIR
jgi:hypothetical protein